MNKTQAKAHVAHTDASSVGGGVLALSIIISVGSTAVAAESLACNIYVKRHAENQDKHYLEGYGGMCEGERAERV